MEKQPFYLTKRKLPSGKKVYYYYYYDCDGNRTVPKSTGETNKQKAFNFCIKLFNANNLANRKIKFKEFAKDWFTPNCQWYKDRAASKPLKQNTINSLASDLKKHILPFFKDMDIEKITPSHIKDFRIALVEKGLKNSTINRTIVTLKMMMNYAVDDKLIPENPVSMRIKAFEITERREAFSLEEIKYLLHTQWDSKEYWFFTLTGIITGMRISEIAGLQPEHLHGNYIDVCQQYNMNQIQSVKTNESRFVTCPETIVSLMLKVCDNKDFVFPNRLDAFKPINTQLVRRDLYTHYSPEMEERRKSVNLTFHSFRYFFNTYLIYKEIQESKINFLMGHSTKKGSMFNLYTTWNPDMYKDVLDVQNELLKELEVEKIINNMYNTLNR